MLKLVLLVGIASTALAEEDAALVEEWHLAHYECRMGEALDGAQITFEQSAASCAVRSDLTEVLEMHGLCWSTAEQEWNSADNEDGLCDP